MAAQEDLDFYVELSTLTKEFDEAKALQQANPGDEECEARWRAAKLAIREHRAHWRSIRRYFQDLAIAGDDEAMAAFQAEVGEGGAVAAPAPLSGATSSEGV